MSICQKSEKPLAGGDRRGSRGPWDIQLKFVRLDLANDRLVTLRDAAEHLAGRCQLDPRGDDARYAFRQEFGCDTGDRICQSDDVAAAADRVARGQLDAAVPRVRKGRPPIPPVNPLPIW